MGGSVNKVVLIGRLGADPEVRSFQNGSKVCNLRVATSETWKDRESGEKRERTEWHAVAIFAEHTVRFAEQYLRKGSLVYVEGKLETRKWQDQSGQDRYTTEVTVRPYGGDVKGLSDFGGDSQQDSQSGGYGSQSSGGYGSGGSAMDDGDTIPF